MLVSKLEDKAPSDIGCFPNFLSLYSTISHDVRMHMERVGTYGEQFLRYLKAKMPSEELEVIPEGFYRISRKVIAYHDIGRVYIPVRVLNKPEGLTKEEFELVKQHVNYAGRALKAVYVPPFEAEYMELLYNIATYHHERYDGTGYPNRIAGTDIPFLARVCSIVDAYDGMTSWKPYRKSLERDVVIKVYEEEAGKQFDPVLSRYFIQLLKERRL